MGLDVGYVKVLKSISWFGCCVERKFGPAITGKRILVAHSTGGCIGLEQLQDYNISEQFFIHFADWQRIGAPMVRNFVALIKSFTH